MGQNGKYSETIKQFIIENFLFGDSGKLNEDTLLFEKGILDSTGILELVAFIEDNFNISVKEEDLVIENFLNIKAIDKFLKFKIDHC